MSSIQARLGVSVFDFTKVEALEEPGSFQQASVAKRVSAARAAVLGSSSLRHPDPSLFFSLSCWLNRWGVMDEAFQAWSLNPIAEPSVKCHSIVHTSLVSCLPYGHSCLE